MPQEHSELAGDDVAIAPDQMLVRLVTSFATVESEIEKFASLVQSG